MRNRKHCLSISVSAAVAAILAGHAATAHAEPPPRFVIPAQPLGDALRAVGAQSSLNIVFDAGLVDGRRAPAIDARLSPEQAVARLLEGTGIRHRFLDASTLVLQAAGSVPPDAGAAREPDTGTPIRLAQAAQQPSDSGEHRAEPLEEIVVRGLVFKYDEVETANKMGLSVKETPQSVKVITADVLDFSHVEKFEDSYKLDAGAYTSHSQDQFVRTYLRGFQLDAPKVDGFRTSNYPTLDLAPFERFEIIKGATSTVYGHAPVGGTINAVSKKPLREAGGELSLEGGNFGHMRGDADFHGPLTDKLSYRVVAAYLDEDSFLDVAFNKRKVLAPSLKYDFTPNTSLTLMGQYQDAEFLSSYGFGPQYVGGFPDGDPRNYQIPHVPRSRIAVNPDGLADREFLMGRAYLEHRFQNGWTLRANLQSIHVDVLNEGSYAFEANEDGDAIMYMYVRDAEQENYSGEVNLFGRIEAFGREHTLFFGADYVRVSGTALSGFGNAIDPQYAGFNLYRPDYGVFLPFPASAAGYPGIYNERNVSKEYGITAQAIVRPTDRLSVMLGTRYSHVETGDIWSFDAGPLSHVIDDEDMWSNHATTFQGGITYKLTDAVNLYASYGETFTPRNEITVTGSRVGPEEGKAYEAGAKGDAFAGRLNWSTAVFDIARTNISQAASPGSAFVVLLGKQRARGVEFDAQGEITEGWDVYLSAAILKNEFVDGQFDGFASYLAPKRGLSLFTSYEWQGGWLQGFGIGGGVVYKKRGRFPTFDGYPYPSDPATGVVYFDHLFDDPLEVDLRAFYRRNRWNLEVAATNVFGDKYYSPVENTLSYGLGVNPGTQLIGKISYEF